MGAERYRKEYVVDMKPDITLIAEYLSDKLGDRKALVQKQTDWSKMAEMKLDKEKVGWHLMATAGEAKLRKWLEDIIEKGELGAVGESPPNLLEELGLAPEDMDLGNADPEDDAADMGQIEQVCGNSNSFEHLQAL